MTSTRGSYYISDNVLTARDPEQPDKAMWSKKNAEVPIWCGGSLVIRVRHGDGSGSAGNSDIRLTALDPLTGSVRWESAGTDEPYPSSFCDGSTLVTDNAGVLEARELSTGRMLWTSSAGTVDHGSFTSTRPAESRVIMQNGARITALIW